MFREIRNECIGLNITGSRNLYEITKIYFFSKMVLNFKKIITEEMKCQFYVLIRSRPEIHQFLKSKICILLKYF